VSRPFIRAAVAALTAVGLALSSGALPERGASAAIEVAADITLAFESGCQGSGTYEVVNETKGVVQNRQATTWSASKPILVEDASAGIADRGDRLVVRLLDADGRLLFTAPVPFLDDVIVNQYRLPDYLLLARLDCARVPYEVTYHLSYDTPATPPTSTTAPEVDGDPRWPPAVLGLLFGLALVASSVYAARRDRHRGDRRGRTIPSPHNAGDGR